MFIESDRTQQMVLVSEVLPSLFQDSPEQFIRLLARDGTKLLRFYWDEAGKRLGRRRSGSGGSVSHGLQRASRV